MTRGLLLRLVGATLTLLAFGYAGMELGVRRERTQRLIGPPARLVDREILFNAIAPTPEQWRDIEAILDETQVATDSIMGTLLRDVLTATRSADARIEALLTPDQRLAFDSLDARPMLRRRAPP